MPKLYDINVSGFVRIEFDKEPTDEEALQAFADMPESELIGCMEVDSIEEVK